MEKNPGSDVELLAFLFCYEWEAMGEVGAIWGDLGDKSFVNHTLQRPRVSRTSFYYYSGSRQSYLRLKNMIFAPTHLDSNS